jgi:hypothetical protein
MLHIWCQHWYKQQTHKMCRRYALRCSTCTMEQQVCMPCVGVRVCQQCTGTYQIMLIITAS